jgi:hypothetical protein
MQRRDRKIGINEEKESKERELCISDSTQEFALNSKKKFQATYLLSLLLE